MVDRVPAVDKGDGSRREADDDKRGLHESETTRGRRWAERDQAGAQGSFPMACARWRGEFTCHIVQSGKYISPFIVYVVNL